MGDTGFSARAFLKDNFQGVGGLIAHCRALGIEPPSEAQAQKWMTRNAIPGEWLTKILGMLEAERGEPVSLVPYMGASE